MLAKNLTSGTFEIIDDHDLKAALDHSDGDARRLRTLSLQPRSGADSQWDVVVTRRRSARCSASRKKKEQSSSGEEPEEGRPTGRRLRPVQ